MPASFWRHPGYTPRRTAGLTGYERVLARAGLSPVAGIDEAGRGACAGPLVVAAVALDPRRVARCTDLADSKMLSAPVREQAYQQVLESALSWHVVVIPPGDIDRIGLHVCNVTGMRRALAGLAARPGYVLTDGFPVRGLAVPALAMWKGDEVAACVAAASVIAKVTSTEACRSPAPSLEGSPTDERCGAAPRPEHHDVVCVNASAVRRAVLMADGGCTLPGNPDSRGAAAWKDVCSCSSAIGLRERSNVCRISS